MIGFQALSPQKELFADLAPHVYPVVNFSLSNIQRGLFKQTINPTATYESFYTYEPPSLDVYTQFSLQAYFLVFWGLMLLQSLMIMIADYLLVKTIPQSTSIWQRFVHAIQKSHCPFPHENWYQGNGNCQDHINRKNAVQLEVLITMGINFLFNTIFLIPLVILCKLY